MAAAHWQEPRKPLPPYAETPGLKKLSTAYVSPLSMVHSVPLLLKLTLKLGIKSKIWVPFLHHGEWDAVLPMRGDIRHPLLLECFITFLIHIRHMWGPSVNRYEPHMVHTVQFLPGWTLKLRTKCKLLGTLSAPRMGWCTSRRDMHCFWSIV